MGSYFLLFIITVSFDMAVQSNDNVAVERAIINGYEAPLRPFYVMIITQVGESYSQCGGTVIGPWHVLSAAHCFPNGTCRLKNYGSSPIPIHPLPKQPPTVSLQ